MTLSISVLIRFVYKCCPGLTLEEFNVFRTMKMLETLGDMASDDIEEEDEEEIEGDNNFYTVPISYGVFDGQEDPMYDIGYELSFVLGPHAYVSHYYPTIPLFFVGF